MRKVFFFMILFIVAFIIQSGWTEKVKLIDVKFNVELIIVDADIDEPILQYPQSVELQEENIFVLDKKGSSVKKYNEKGKFLFTIGREGHGSKELSYPEGFSIKNEKIYISNSGNSRIEIFGIDGSFKGSFKLNQQPGKILTDSQGNLLINFTQKNFLVQKYSEHGQLIKSFVPESDSKVPMLRMFYSMITMTMGEKDEFFVLYRFRNRIEKYNSKGDLVFSSKRPLTFDYKPLKPVSTQSGTSLNARPLGINIAYNFNNKIIYVLTWQGKKEEDDTLCDRIDSSGKYIDSFKIPFPCNFIQFDDKNNTYLINSYESTVYKCKILGLR